MDHREVEDDPPRSCRPARVMRWGEVARDSMIADPGSASILEPRGFCVRRTGPVGICWRFALARSAHRAQA